MKTYAIRSALLSILGAVLALAAGPALATSFRLTDLGPTIGVAVNASGQATGFVGTGHGLHAILWDGSCKPASTIARCRRAKIGNRKHVQRAVG